MFSKMKQPFYWEILSAWVYGFVRYLSAAGLIGKLGNRPMWKIPVI